jgi:glucosyl-dolichyl phosphate glucuronosyltransferase
MITVILCTLNRCESLAKTLESVAASTLPNSVEWEVLVIDNNSMDHTREVVEDFSSRCPFRFRYLFEPQPGKSFALNTGIREAKGDVLAFLDDDVIVEPTWLQNLTAPLEDGKWAGSGGRTLLAQTFKPPRWMTMEGPWSMGGTLAALFDLGSEPRELNVAPYGTNMAYRREMFEKYGLFRTDLGPSPNHVIPRPNEDTEFGRRLMAEGEHLYYEPSAIVYHPLLQDRVKKEYFLTWWFDFGRAQMREKGRRPPVWWIIPRHYLTIPHMICVVLSQKALGWMCTLNPQRRFLWKLWTWIVAGHIVETYRIARETKSQK